MIAALALGGFAGIDRTAFAQTMFAHPVVCGTLAGWIAGDPASGLRLGIVYGMFSSRRAPIGGEGLVADWSSAAIAVPLALGDSAAGWQWGLGLVAGLAAALVGGRLIRLLRRLAASSEVMVAEAAVQADLARIERVHLSLLGLQFLRGAVWVAIAAVLTSVLAFDVRWSRPEQSAAAMIWGLAPMIAVPVLVHAHWRHAGWRPVGFGIAAATLLVVLAGVLQ
jgi:mannose/fructose/N-acetylgalactosamine-specific phosphotransferase system component IIC